MFCYCFSLGLGFRSVLFLLCLSDKDPPEDPILGGLLRFKFYASNFKTAG